MPEWCIFNHAVEDAPFKIIMDKISKRSKGYAFIEYTTDEAASAALKEMNGKIGVAPDRNFDMRTITDPLSSRSSKIFRLLLSRGWTILILPPKFCSMSSCKRQQPLSAPDLQVK
uniref:RRM domain-containing protein n=1 Tax=Quercus lobata TaxID=97700 RepID=A0A7N2LHF5_QUELO